MDDGMIGKTAEKAVDIISEGALAMAGTYGEFRGMLTPNSSRRPTGCGAGTAGARGNSERYSNVRHSGPGIVSPARVACCPGLRFQNLDKRYACTYYV
jgi:hypothetical protein